MLKRLAQLMLAVQLNRKKKRKMLNDTEDDTQIGGSLTSSMSVPSAGGSLSVSCDARGVATTCVKGSMSAAVGSQGSQGSLKDDSPELDRKRRDKLQRDQSDRLGVRRMRIQDEVAIPLLAGEQV